MNSLPDDPYLALGLSRDATAADIRKVYLKLVVKSHPDKFQDPVEKAKKADEFHKIQQAYELLSDDSKRAKYHEELKLAELRREMGRTTIRATGGVNASTTTFSYNVHNAEPRPSTFTSRARDSDHRTPTRSFEDIDIEILRRSAKKPASGEKSRPGARDDDRRRRMDDDLGRDRDRREKESQKSSRSDRKKTRDKEIRRGYEDKFKSTREPYAGAVDSEEELRRSSRNDRRSPRSTSRYVDDYIRLNVTASESERKMSAQMASASQYTEQVRRKDMMDEPRAGISRSTTFNENTVKFRHVDPLNDTATPRRSSASTRPAVRRTPEAKTRDSPRSSKDKKSYNPEPRVISVPDPSRPPPLKTNRSDPLNLNIGHKEPIRSKTFASPKSRKEVPLPTLNRSQTWQPRGHSARVDEYSTSESSESSEDDEPVPRRRPNMPTRQTTYKVGQKGDSTYVTPHAPEDSDAGGLRPQVAHVRPHLNRTGASSYETRAPPVRSQSQSQPFAPRTASPENYQSSKVSGRPKYFQQPPYGGQINVAEWDFDALNVEKSYRRATSDRYHDEQRSRHTRGVY